MTSASAACLLGAMLFVTVTTAFFIAKDMKILLVGGGGREHALAWKLAQDGSRPEIYCAPGNAGTAALGVNLDLAATDLDGLLHWAKSSRPDLVVIGPEAPLCAGLVDRLGAEGIRAFGPNAAAARLEGSKQYAKDVLRRSGVPTARAETFDAAAPARAYLRQHGAPVVIKADGLAAGKGVFVCATMEEAEQALDELLERDALGTAGRTVLIEDYLEGEEASIMALVDGRQAVLLASSQDHKRALDGDQGPNTGGMGAYSPAPVVGERWWPILREQVFQRTLDELARRGVHYRGVLYAGLMFTPDGPKVLEFNCRFGDPETQAILPRWEGDLVPALEACATGELEEKMVRWKSDACVSVVLAAGGYPGSYRRGDLIEGLGDVEKEKDVVVFHAGTSLQEGRVVTAGGRVLNVTALGADIRSAAERAYAAAARIRFDGMYYRRDIAARALHRRRAVE